MLTPGWQLFDKRCPYGRDRCVSLDQTTLNRPRMELRSDRACLASRHRLMGKPRLNTSSFNVHTYARASKALLDPSAPASLSHIDGRAQCHQRLRAVIDTRGRRWIKLRRTTSASCLEGLTNAHARSQEKQRSGSRLPGPCPLGLIVYTFTMHANKSNEAAAASRHSA